MHKTYGQFQGFYDRLHQMHNARHLQATVNTRAAAAYMRKLGWSIEAALWILLGKEAR